MSVFKSREWSPFFQSLAGALFALILVAGVQLVADPSPDDLPHLVPYSGQINDGGEPLTGEVDLRFGLHNSAEGGIRVWTETHEGVSVFNGEFSVLLGDGDSGDALNDAVWQTGPVFLAVEVRPEGVEGWITLTGRQRIGPAPYARLSAGVSGFDNLVLGDIRGAYPGFFDRPSTRGLKIFEGSDNAFFGLVSRSEGNDNAYDTHLYYGDDVDDSLIVSSEDGGTALTLNGSGGATFEHAVTVKGNFTVQGTMTGNLSMNGQLDIDGPVVYQGVHNDRGTIRAIDYSPPYILSVANETRQIPNSILQSHCEDRGGCRVTIVSRNFDAGGRHPSRSFQLFTSGGRWRADWPHHDLADGIDGDGGHHHFWLWNCLFGDSNWPSTGHDGGESLYLHSNASRGCDIRIDD